MKNLPKIMLALALLAFAPLAHAQESKQEPKQERKQKPKQERNGYFRIGLGFGIASEKEITQRALRANRLIGKDKVSSAGTAIEMGFGGYMGDYFAIEAILSVFYGKVNEINVEGVLRPFKIEELIVTGMGNIYLISRKANMQPFIGLGVGSGSQRISIESASFTGKSVSNFFAWNASTGVNFFLTDNFALGVSYQFLASEKPSEIHSHAVLFNLNSNF